MEGKGRRGKGEGGKRGGGGEEGGKGRKGQKGEEGRKGEKGRKGQKENRTNIILWNVLSIEISGSGLLGM